MWNTIPNRADPVLDTSISQTKRPRIASLDVIRGVAILGVLAVNADGFAAPIHASLNPSAWMFGNQGGTAIAYWVMDWLFHDKFVAIFSMLFGISMFLVGGELSDRQRGIHLARRIGALFLFAMAHGFGLWWGDILSTYACAGIVMFFVRSLPSRTLLAAGLGLYLAAAYPALPVAGPAHDAAHVAASQPTGKAPASQKIQAELAQATGSARGALQLNAQTYVHQLHGVAGLLPHTLALMMIGLGLFKTGFFAGASPGITYVRTAAAGAAGLAFVGAVTWMLDVEQRPLPLAEFAHALLSPGVALGYVAAIILWLHSRAGRLLAPFAAAGRMAFTNYLTQSLIMTSIFYGGRGALMGQVDRPALWCIVAIVWVVQLVWSTWWLARFEMGPLEWIWRWMTYGKPSPFRRS
jgi:uncharacterized protein